VKSKRAVCRDTCLDHFSFVSHVDANVGADRLAAIVNDSAENDRVPQMNLKIIVRLLGHIHAKRSLHAGRCCIDR
jgi:hypothetical protein